MGVHDQGEDDCGHGSRMAAMSFEATIKCRIPQGGVYGQISICCELGDGNVIVQSFASTVWVPIEL